MTNNNHFEEHNPYIGRTPEDTVPTSDGSALIGSAAARNAIQAALNPGGEAPTPLTPKELEARSDRIRDLLTGETKPEEQVIPRALVPKDRQLGSIDVGGVPTTQPGARLVQQKDGSYQPPAIGTIGAPGEQVPLDQTTPEGRRKYFERVLNNDDK
ncbi:MAG TPA: hypothetical protein VLF60_01050 [Candidatus Saccharimonadales bacterium]|nr:hypothetical protein [Candidatus Saccharimonadales bacterium]